MSVVPFDKDFVFSVVVVVACTANPTDTANTIAPTNLAPNAVGPNNPYVTAALSNPADWDAVKKQKGETLEEVLEVFFFIAKLFCLYTSVPPFKFENEHVDLFYLLYVML